MCHKLWLLWYHICTTNVSLSLAVNQLTEDFTLASTEAFLLGNCNAATPLFTFQCALQQCCVATGGASGFISCVSVVATDALSRSAVWLDAC